jgi:Zn-dependent M28 family amino/carboxypeptidase
MTPDTDELAQRLRRHVEALAATPREPGSAAHARARQYIRSHLEGAGFAVRELASRCAGFECISLLTEPVATELPLVIIGAHYDTVPGSPGADDNASAVAALLELARWIGPRLGGARLAARLQLAAYDLEEYGLLGSDAHCREVQRAGRPLRGMVSLEMLGYTDTRPGSQRLPPHLAGLYPDVANFIGVVGNESSRDLLATFAAQLQTVPGLPVEQFAVPGDGSVLPETRLSDHSNFWDRGYPALMLTDTSFLRNPHYHQASDTPGTLDYPFLARVSAGVCRASWQLLAAERLG